MVHTEQLDYTTEGFMQIKDITDDVLKVVEASGVKNGFVTVFTQHTTTAIKINENEAGFFKDLKKFCEDFIPAKAEYHHNDLEVRDPKTLCPIVEHCLNGHSHLLQMFLGTASETIPLQDAKPMFGTWQRILFVECDMKKERHVIVQVVGE